MQHGSQHFRGYTCDLRDEEAIVKMIESIWHDVGRIQILINNAGLGRESSLIYGDVKDWKEIFDVNVMALAVCTKVVVKDLVDKDLAGSVVHISSLSGHRVPVMSNTGAGSNGMYCASKFAVRSLTESLRQELRSMGSRIRVCQISPGFVETNFLATHLRSPKRARTMYSQMESMKSEDVASAVMYVLSTPEHVEIHDILMRPTSQKS
eukprot:TRINITY_DN3564_c0_g1_i4.p1 TRINITY_DN3564_c0_g1~~TRINITY_DN3564_c0_g1_i4.p1  ORF type:complete len:208 (+),score=44.14 TRINITY_DN3564_c0_g1_i4:225-848(+)